MLIIGDQEVENKELSLRTRGRAQGLLKEGAIGLEEIIKIATALPALR